MYTKSVKWLSYGDILAEDITVQNQPVLKAGTTLTVKHILKIHALGIDYVKIKASPFLTDQLAQQNQNPFRDARRVSTGAFG